MQTVKVMMSATVVLGSTLLAQAAGTYFDTTYNQGGLGSINYRVYLPESYSPDAELPVVLYLHSAAERGTSVSHIFSNNYGGFTWTNDWIGGLVDATQTGEHQAILVMPQSGLGSYWNSMTNGENWNTPNYNNATQNATPISPRLQLAVNALGQVLNNYSTDANRVYVTGPSMGGWGTWDALARIPQFVCSGDAFVRRGQLRSCGDHAGQQADLDDAWSAGWFDHPGSHRSALSGDAERRRQPDLFTNRPMKVTAAGTFFIPMATTPP
ncbi:MAG: hypothetical protein HC898_04010 [Phycisphaerales bacterium]|nr:hypothetical protein [Phycisphaerales bacterium]